MPRIRRQHEIATTRPIPKIGARMSSSSSFTMMRERPTTVGNSERLLQRPPNRRFTALIFAGQFRHGLAGRVTLAYAPALAGIEHIGPTKLRAFSFCPPDTFLTPLADQVALELGNAA